MDMVISDFRSAFPEFTSEQKYPDTMLTFWGTAGEALLNEERWGDLYTHGLYLFVAHQITLSSVDVASGDAGRTPGQSSGIIASKGVDGVSVSYNSQAFLLDNAGNFNMTRYGREFWQLANIIGMGGYQV